MRIHICRRRAAGKPYRRNYWTLKYSVGRKTRQQPIEFRVYRFATLPFRGSCRQIVRRTQRYKGNVTFLSCVCIRIYIRKNIVRSRYRGRRTDRLPSLISNQWRQPSRYNGRSTSANDPRLYDNLDVDRRLLFISFHSFVPPRRSLIRSPADRSIYCLWRPRLVNYLTRALRNHLYPYMYIGKEENRENATRVLYFRGTSVLAFFFFFFLWRKRCGKNLNWLEFEVIFLENKKPCYIIFSLYLLQLYKYV